MSDLNLSLFLSKGAVGHQCLSETWDKFYQWSHRREPKWTETRAELKLFKTACMRSIHTMESSWRAHFCEQSFSCPGSLISVFTASKESPATGQWRTRNAFLYISMLDLLVLQCLLELPLPLYCPNCCPLNTDTHAKTHTPFKHAYKHRQIHSDTHANTDKYTQTQTICGKNKNTNPIKEYKILKQHLIIMRRFEANRRWSLFPVI